MKNKLLVFCLDALCTMDLAYMKTLPNFALFFEKGAIIEKIEPVYPSLTYPCHVSILTGVYPHKHGINHNEKVAVGRNDSPWFNQASDVQAETLLERAKTNGLSVCSLSWPVTGGMDIDYNMPMIVPIGYTGDNPLQFFRKNATENLLEAYYWKYGRHLMGKDRSLDLFTMAIAPDLIKDFGQPDVMLIKMCDLDSVRHKHGVNNSYVKEQLKKHDTELGVLFEAVKRYGNYKDTNFIVLGDHGQSDVEFVLNLNKIFEEHGLISSDGEGNLLDYTAWCHSCGLSAWIEMKNPEDEAAREKVYTLLKSLFKDKRYGLGYFFTKEQVLEEYHLSGPFEFVIEGTHAVSFSSTLTAESVITPINKNSYKTAVASHGCLPFKDQTTTFMAMGPSVKEGIIVDKAQMVDEAPTMAKILGFHMPDTDGKAIAEILR